MAIKLLRDYPEYTTRYGILDDAGVAVLLTRTKEPLRCIDNIKQFAIAKKRPCKVWTVTDGWASFDATGKEKGKPDGAIDIGAALRALRDAGNAGTIHVMMNVHHWLNKSPQVVQLVKEYADTFTEGQNRLVLIAPTDFTPAAELQDDLPILDFGLPSVADLQKQWDALMGDSAKQGYPVPELNKADVEACLHAGQGLTAFEFVTALSRALFLNAKKLPKVNPGDFIQAILECKVETVKRSEVLSLLPAIEMEEVGGLEFLKEWLDKRVACFGKDAKEFGVDAPKGITLVGPPGTGKSLVSRAIAGKLRLPLVRFDTGAVFSSLVGSSEARLRNALHMVDAMAPCVMLIDEVDKAFQKEGGGDSGVGRRVLGTFLTWMQDQQGGVFVVMTANKVDNLPVEILRRGRVDEIFFVGMPTEEEREEIASIHIAKRGFDPDKIKLSSIVSASDGYAPAEIETAIKEAIINVWNDSDKPKKEDLTAKEIVSTLKVMTPMSKAFSSDIDAMTTWAANNARPAGRANSEGAGPRVRSRSLGGGRRSSAEISG